MADNKSPNNGDLSTIKQRLIDKLLNKFAQEIANQQQIPLPEALEIAKELYQKPIEKYIEVIIANQENQVKAIETALEDETKTNKIAENLKKEIATVETTKNPMEAIAGEMAADSNDTTDKPLNNPSKPSNNINQGGGNIGSTKGKTTEPGNPTTPNNSKLQKPNISGNGQASSNPTSQNSQQPTNPTTNPNNPGNSQPDGNNPANSNPDKINNPDSTQAQIPTPDETKFKKPDLIPTSSRDPDTNSDFNDKTSSENVNNPPKTKNLQPGTGNLKPENGGANTLADNTPNIPPNPSFEKFKKGRGAGRIGGAAPGGFIRSGENYTGNRFKKDAEPVTIERIQKGADTGLERASNVINQARGNIEKGDVDKADKQLKVAESIRRKASRLAANSRFRLAVEAFKKQLIAAAAPIIAGLLMGALFIGLLAIFTVAVLCVMDRNPVGRNFLPNEAKGKCGGKDEGSGNVNCPAGYTAWVQDASGKWTQTANNTTTTGNGSEDRGTGIGDIICLAAPRTGDLADPYLRAFMRGLGEAENGGSYAVSNGCVGKYQFCSGGIYAGVSGKSDSFGGTFPSDPTQMTPKQQDAAFITAWEADYSFRGGPSISELKNILKTNGIQAALDRSSQGTSATASDGVTRFGMCGTWTPLCSSSIDDVQGKQTLIKGVYNKVLAEELAGKCGTKTTSNDTNQNNTLQTLATVTNNLKQFFQPIRAEAQARVGKDKIDQIQSLINSGKIVDAIQIVAPNRPSLMVQVSTQPVDPKAIDLIIAIANSGQVDSFRITSLYRPDNVSAGHREGRAIDIDQIVVGGKAYTHYSGFLGGEESANAFAKFGNYLATTGVDYLITAGAIHTKLEKTGSFTKDSAVANKPFLQNDPAVHADHFHIEVGKNPITGGTNNPLTSTSGPVICCPPGVTPTGAGITGNSSQVADIDGLSADGKKLLGGISAIIEQKEGAVTTVPGGFGVGFEKYNNPGNITSSSSLNSEKAAIDKKFPVSAADKAKGITSYVSKDLKNPNFLAFYTPEIGRWYLQDYILYQLTQGEGNFRTAQTWGDFMRAYAPPQDNNATNKPGQGSTSYIDMFKDLGLLENTPLKEVKSKLGLKTGNNINQENDNLLQKLAAIFTPIKAEAQNTNGIERAQIIVLHITAGGNGTPEADRGQLAFVQNPPGCSKSNCKSYNELILSDGKIEKLQTQGGNVVGTGAGWVYDINPATWKAGNARITGASGSGVINSISYQISYPISKLKGEEGDRLTSNQVKSTAQTLTEFAKAGGRAENIFTHASLDPRERSEDRPFINFDGSVNGQLVELVSLIRANGQWKTGNYANISDQELATIITMINVENAIAASEKSGDSALPASDLNKLKAAAEKLREQLKNKTFQINQGGSPLTTGAGCVQANSANNGNNTNNNGNSVVPGAPVTAEGQSQLTKLARQIKTKLGQPDGTCYKQVADAIDEIGGFGKIPVGFRFDAVTRPGDSETYTSTHAMQFGIYLNQPGKLDQYGMRNLKAEGITNPNDPRVPFGAVIVVDGKVPGSPVSFTYGDINVKTDQGFLNFGVMSFMNNLDTKYIIGIYIPK